MRGGYFVHQRFGDVDELDVLARDWDLDFRQLSRGRFRGRLTQLGNEGFTASRIRLEGLIHQRGSGPAPLRSFALPVRRQMELRWRDHQLGPDQLLVFPASGELDSTSAHDFDMYVLTVGKERLDEAAHLVGIAGLGPILSGVEMVSCTNRSMNELRRWCAGLLSGVAGPPATGPLPPIDPAVERRSAELLVAALISGRPEGPGREVGRRLRLTEEAARIARAHGAELEGVAALCREVGTSPRTLRRGFRERFGVTPGAFLKAQRLIAVRRALRDADPSRTQVADVVNRFGFWHLGQLAADYRGHFGELPSQTLARAPLAPGRADP